MNPLYVIALWPAVLCVLIMGFSILATLKK